MQVIKSLHQMLRTRCPGIHASRLKALMTNVESLAWGQKLTVTGLGRNSRRRTSRKHAIKQSDRLVNNPHLATEQFHLYRAITHGLIGHATRPLITVDWSDYTYDRTWIFLRASVPAGGRALTLYEEVHPLRCYGNAAVQKRFLRTLKALLPDGVQPILVTDAGFIGPWFRAVTALGWDYLGRIRPNLLYQDAARREWQRCLNLYPQATRHPHYYGLIQLAKCHPLTCHLHLYHKPAKGRHKRTLAGQRSQRKVSNANALRETSPWLVVTSLAPEHYPAKMIMPLYRTRMQIEQAFRDIKNTRSGFCLRQTRSRSLQRLANLLLIGMLASLVLWLVGRMAEQQKQHYQYQANSLKHRRVLSLFFLGQECLKQFYFKWRAHYFNQAMQLLHSDMKQQIYP